jgi:hypothetical protein
MTQGEAVKTTDSFFDSRNGEDIDGRIRVHTLAKRWSSTPVGSTLPI